MPNSDLLPSLLFKLNENQLALEAAILELSVMRSRIESHNSPPRWTYNIAEVVPIQGALL